MNFKVTKATACLLAGVVTLGTVSYGALANPTAGVSSYASNIMTVSAMPTAGVSLAFTNTMMASAENVVLASVQENETPEVAEGQMEEAQPAEENPYANIGIAQLEGGLNVRSTPSEEGDVIGQLYNNSCATILGEENGWYLIQSGNVNGYVKADYVSVGNEEVIRAASRRVANVTTETLRVREQPTTESEIVTLVPEGDQLTVVDESIEGWVGVTVTEGTGYVSTEFVSLDTEYVYGETIEEIETRLQKEEEARQAALRAAATSQAATSSNANFNYTAPSGTGASSVVDFASQFVGNPYVYGGTSLTSGADCSGFVMSVYAQFGVGLPHSSYAMRSVGYGVTDMLPGDIVCYSGHVGIYAGNGTIVHAANERYGITYSSVDYMPIIAVRRIF